MNQEEIKKLIDELYPQETLILVEEQDGIWIYRHQGGQKWGVFLALYNYKTKETQAHYIERACAVLIDRSTE